MAEAGRAACSFAVPVRPAGASVQPWQPVFPPRRTNATRLRVPRATGQLPCRLACAAQAGNPAFWDPVAIAGFSSTDPGAPAGRCAASIQHCALAEKYAASGYLALSASQRCCIAEIEPAGTEVPYLSNQTRSGAPASKLCSAPKPLCRTVGSVIPSVSRAVACVAQSASAQAVEIRVRFIGNLAMK